MDNAHIGVARQLMVIAERVEQKKISFVDIPFDDIITLVSSTYQNKAEMGEYFVGLYGGLITKALENSDAEMISQTLKVLAQHILIFSIDDIKINEGNIQRYKLQSKVGYLKNCEKIRERNLVENANDKPPFDGKGVVYSAITGSYDDIKEPEYINPEWDYILFTNNPNISSSVWKVCFLENTEGLDNVRLARHVKIMGHQYLKDYDYSIWVDGKLKIKDNLRECIETYRKKEPLLCFNHYVNDCVYQEWKACLALKKDEPDIMEAQMKRYKEEKYPEHNGMIDSAILIRDLKNIKMQAVMQTWWEQILRGSRRDQLSFNYACWKNDFLYDTTDLFIYGNKYVELYGHN